MLKQLTAQFTILFMVLANAAPLLTREAPCEESCCTTMSCCEMDENAAATRCEMEMTSCAAHVFIPLITAPLVKQEHQVQLTIESRPDPVQLPLITQCQFPPNTHEADSGPAPFRTLPLLI